MKYTALFLISLVTITVAGCKKSKDNPSPEINAISPDNGVYSTIVTISGNNFSTTLSDLTVEFNGKTAKVLSATANQLTVEVPKGAGSGAVTVRVGGKTVTGPVFNYTYITTVTTLAGSSQGYADGAGTAAQFASPISICADAQGNIYVADVHNDKVRKITPAGVVSTFAGSAFGFADGSGTVARFKSPWGICSDAIGNIYVCDVNNYNIRKITPSAVVSTLAGEVQGNADGTGTAARFHSPVGITADAQGNVYVTDEGNHNIRKITASGVVTIFAGSSSGQAGNTNGTGTAARFNNPRGICIDAQGNLYVADGANHIIRKISSAGVVTTFAGSTSGYADGNGVAAQFSSPCGVAIDSVGNLFVADAANHKIRKISPAGVVTTFAGGSSGYADGSPGSARFNSPYGICLDVQGSVYVADRMNYKIRKIIVE